MTQEDEKRLMQAAHNVWAWVGPGDPDLDDSEERDAFMRDVLRLASVYFFIQKRTAA